MLAPLDPRRRFVMSDSSPAISNSSSYCIVDAPASLSDELQQELEDLGISALSVTEPKPEPPVGESAGTAPLTRSRLEQHTKLEDSLLFRAITERRQFNCPTHGTFWKKTYSHKPVARCKPCNRAHGGQGGPKYLAIPIDEERGQGLYECVECAHVWTSNHACRSLQQYCSQEGCAAAEAQRGTCFYPWPWPNPHPLPNPNSNPNPSPSHLP